MLESNVEDYLVKRVTALGGEVRKVKWIGRKSAPDRLVMLPKVHHAAWRSDSPLELGCVCWRYAWDQPARGIWIELKKPGGLDTFPKDARERAQFREHERMRAMGQRVVVIDSCEGVDEVLA